MLGGGLACRGMGCWAIMNSGDYCAGLLVGMESWPQPATPLARRYRA